ncbi:ABC transporter substrate-binding protein [Pontibacillus litoralis]|uniref:Sugar ABC transporter substrate-binding protein n=1 Tax=Pontibacillus litoralis JSM 072002 TaxID=1385512 RepID=A0A0A5G6V5_9BACI|nr:ABC transporter substrate-binding protein [Pontibacillus litoralis]KGX87789.1 sugar ABC transporter substrate-binding protein [Pontibacillus litoralis JSM 072002]
MLRKTKGILVAMFGSVLMLAGCSFSSGDSDGATGGEKVTVDVFQFKVEFKEQFDKLVETYEEENPNVDINVKTVGGGNDYGAALKSAFSSGEAPDIFNVGGPADVEQYKDYVVDLSDTKSAEAALDGTLSSVTVDGDVYGLPYNQEGYGIIYNKEVFKEAGIEPTEIKTMDDLEEATKTLDNKKKELGIEAPFALPGKETWVMGIHLANAYLADEFDHDVMKAYESETVAFEMGDQMKRFLDLQNEYSVQPTLSLDYSQQVEELFSLGQVAMIQQGNWVYNTIYEMDTDLAENNIGLLPIPVKGYEGSIPVGVPMYWSLNGDSSEEEIQASKDFLDWLYTSDQGKEFVMEEFKFIPAYEGFDSSKIADPLSQEIYKYAEEGNTLGWVFMGAPTSWTTNKLGVYMQEYIAGDITWEELEQKATKSWEEPRK